MERNDTRYIECLRYVYIVRVDNLGKKSRFWGHTEILYAGECMNIGTRTLQHLFHVNSNFLTKYFRDARIILQFVDYIFGDENDAEDEESKIKVLSKEQKIELINSNRNKLIAYKPCKAIILKKYQHEDEQECIRLDY